MSAQPAAAARREVTVAVLLCLAGAALLLAAAGRSWVSVAAAQPGGLPPVLVPVSGRELTAVPTAVGLVGLAGVAALAASRGWGRVVVGLLLAAAGAGTVAAIVAVAQDLPARASRTAVVRRSLVGGDLHLDRSSWLWVALAGGLLLALAGLVTALRGRRWAALSRRYDAPDSRPRPRDPAASAWESLDRGEDPT